MNKILFLFIYIILISVSCEASPNITLVNGTIITLTGGGTFDDENPTSENLNKIWQNFNTDITLSGSLQVLFNFYDQWTLGTAESYDGSSYAVRFRNLSGSNDARGGLKFDISDNTTSKYYVCFKVRHNTDNQGKFFRMYYGDGSSENFYSTFQYGSENYYSFDETTLQTANGITSGVLPYNQWITIEIYADFTTGAIKAWISGALESNNESFLSIANYDALGGGNVQIGHMVDDTGTEEGYCYDNYYASYTQARIMIGNNITFDSCTHREIQIPISWSDTSITITYNNGSFVSGDRGYLFVIDADGNASAGYDLGTLQADGTWENLKPIQATNLTMSNVTVGL